MGKEVKLKESERTDSYLTYVGHRLKYSESGGHKSRRGDPADRRAFANKYHQHKSQREMKGIIDYTVYS